MNEEGLTEEEMLRKKTYVQICSLSTETTNFKFTDLASLLNVSI